MGNLTQEQAEEISVKAGKAFQPRTPIAQRGFFAGRWDQMTSIVDAVAETGLHVVIYGERGVGKTSIANVIRALLSVFDGDEADERLVIKVNATGEDTFSDVWTRALDEVHHEVEFESLGFSSNVETQAMTLREAAGIQDNVSIDDVRRLLARLSGSVFVFDEFDRLPAVTARQFTDLIKVLSDNAVDSTVVIVGVSETVDELVRDHGSIGRSLVQIPMPRMKPEELVEILEKAQEALDITFEGESSNSIVQMSQGLPHYTHLIGQNAVREACRSHTDVVTIDHARSGLTRAVKGAFQGVRSAYSTATHSAHPDALYREVLLGCAIAAQNGGDEQGFFQASHVVQPLATILDRAVQISTFNKHLAEFSDQNSRGLVLERRGQPRAYRYRFRDPLMPPYVMMDGISTGLLSEEQLALLVP